MKNSKIFFILTVIGVIITIILAAISLYYGVKAYDIAGYSTDNEKVEEAQEKEDLYKYTSIVTGGISVVLLTTGAVFKSKEKM